MKLRQQINNDFLQYMKDNSLRNEFLSTYQNEMDESLVFDEHGIIPYLTSPYFVDQEDKIIFQKFLDRLFPILQKITTSYIEKQEVRDYFEFDKDLESWILSSASYPVAIPITRVDSFFDGTDTFELCEINTDGSSGMNQSETLEKLFLNSPVSHSLSVQYRLKGYHTIDPITEVLPSIYQQMTGKMPKSIAIMDWDDVSLESKNEFTVFEQAFKRKGYETYIVDPRKLVYKDNTLFFEDHPIDLIYRRAVTEELVERKADIQDLLQAYFDGNVIMLGSFLSHVVHSKLAFSFVYELADSIDYFTSEELQFMRKYFPYTKKLVKSSSYEEILKDKDSFVLKPDHLYGSTGIFFGADMTQEAWEEKVASLLDQRYIYQKVARIPNREFLVSKSGEPFAVKDLGIMMGAFCYNYEHYGFYTRVSGALTISAKYGGFIVPNIYVEGKK